MAGRRVSVEEIWADQAAHQAHGQQQQQQQQRQPPPPPPPAAAHDAAPPPPPPLHEGPPPSPAAGLPTAAPAAAAPAQVVEWLNAAAGGTLPTMERLHAADAALLDAAGADGLGTALRSACAQGHGLVVKWLVRRGATVDVQNDLGETPLHNAAGGGFQDCVKALLLAGCDTGLKDKEGATPRDRAKSSSHQKLAALIDYDDHGPKRAQHKTIPQQRTHRRGSVELVSLEIADLKRTVSELEQATPRDKITPETEIQQLRDYKVRVEQLLVRLQGVAERSERARNELSGQNEEMQTELEDSKAENHRLQASMASALESAKKQPTRVTAKATATVQQQQTQQSAAPSDDLIAQFLAEQAAVSAHALQLEGSMVGLEQELRAAQAHLGERNQLLETQAAELTAARDALQQVTSEQQSRARGLEEEVKAAEQKALETARHNAELEAKLAEGSEMDAASADESRLAVERFLAEHALISDHTVTLEAEHSQLQATLAQRGADSSAHEQAMADNQVQIAALEQQVITARSELKASKLEQDRQLEVLGDASQSASEAITGLTAQVAALQSELAAAQSVADWHSTATATHAAEVQTLKASHAAVEQRHTELSVSKSRLEEEIQSARASHAAEVQSVKESHAAVEEQHNGLQRQHADLSASKDQLARVAAEHESRASALQTELREATLEAQKHKAELDSEKQNGTASASQSRLAVERFLAEHALISAHTITLEAEHAQTKSVGEEAHLKVASLQAEMAQRGADSSAHEQAIGDHQRQIATLSQQVTTAQAQVEAAKTGYDQQLSEGALQLTALTAELAAEKHRLAAEIQSVTATHAAEVQTLKASHAAVEQRHTELSASKDELERESYEHESRASEHEARALILETELQEATLEGQAHKDELESERQNVTASTNQSRDAVAQFLKQQVLMSAHAMRMDSEHSQIKVDLAAKHSAVEAHSAHVETLQAELAQKGAHSEMLTDQLAQQQQQQVQSQQLSGPPVSAPGLPLEDGSPPTRRRSGSVSSKGSSNGGSPRSDLGSVSTQAIPTTA